MNKCIVKRPCTARWRLFGMVLLALLVALALGCQGQRSSQTASGGPAAWPPGQPPPGYGQGYPPGGGPGYGAPSGPGYPTGPAAPPPTPPPSVPPPGALPPVPNDPLNNLDIGFMRQRTSGVLGEIIDALPAHQSSLVRSIPLAFDPTPGEVNAYASCTSGKAAMAITDGLLEIEAQMSRAKATDELFGTRKLDAFLQLIASTQRPNQPIVKPPAGFWHPQQDVDGSKVKRQHELFEEAVAFVLGHEMAHHYLQHTGCVGASNLPITPQDIGRVLSNAVPVFNQPNEVAADTNATQNVLAAGARRAGYRWTEGGALLTLHFFERMNDLTPAEAVLFAFELSHPDPRLRIPIVQQTAANWRASGGAPPVWPFPIPGLTG